MYICYIYNKRIIDLLAVCKITFFIDLTAVDKYKDNIDLLIDN